MRITAFLALAVVVFSPAALAQVTITTTGGQGSVINPNNMTNIETVDVTDRNNSSSNSAAFDSSGADVPDINFTQDEDGFYTSTDEQNMTADQRAERDKAIKAEEERRMKERTVQYYRGDAAHKPKLEPKRTHLIYDKTNY